MKPTNWRNCKGPGDASPPEDAPEWICQDCHRTSNEPGECEDCETAMVRNNP
jgi:hypothetical protein